MGTIVDTSKVFLIFIIVLLMMLFPGVLCFFFFFIPTWGGTVRRVGPNESLTTISSCVSLMKDGDTCEIFGGDESTGQLRYTEPHTVQIRDFLDGSKETKIVGVGKYKPLIDGTVTIPSDAALWKQDRQKRWFTNIDHQVWQLSIDGEMQVVARWPNAEWKRGLDGKRDLFSNKNWRIYEGGATDSWAGEQKNGYTGRLYDSKLASLDVDLNGAVGILNIGSWNTFNGKIRDHSPKQPWFQYDDNFGVSHEFPKLLKKGKLQYYIEGTLGLLDASGEWHIEACTKACKRKPYTLYTYDDPRGKTIRGKVQSYVFDIKKSNNLVVENLEFFATTLKATPADQFDAVLDKLTFRDNYFHHASCSKRILGVAAPPEGMLVNAMTEKAIIETSGELNFINNVWYGCDGSPIIYGGQSVNFINNLFKENDWSNANAVKHSGGMATLRNIGYPAKCKTLRPGSLDKSTRPAKPKIDGPKIECNLREEFRRNTLEDNGSTAGLRPAKHTTVILNEVSGQCWGMIQNDGSGIQVKINPQPHTVTSYNWIHDTPKFALRFDCPNQQDPTQPLNLGENGKAHHNVAWNTNGFLFKGYEHYIFHNLAFKKSSMWGTKSHCALCVPHYIGSINIPFNNHTQVDMNVADLADGMEDKNDIKQVCSKRGCRDVCNCAIMKMAGDDVITANAVNGLPADRPRINFGKMTNLKNQNDKEDIYSQLVDAECRDFRPIKSATFTSKYYTSAGIAGAYDVEDEYWIPGRQAERPSNPVPSDKCKARAAYRDTLMFLETYDPENLVTKYEVYMGINASLKKSNKHLNPRSNNHDTQIIKITEFFPGENIRAGDVVSWRVDTVRGAGDITQGDTWTFTAI